MNDNAPAMTEPGCTHPKCVLSHPHAGPAILGDDKGRKPVGIMTERQLLEEIVTTSRATRDLVEGFIADFAKNPALGMLGKMFGGR